MQVHAVPDSERAFDSMGRKLPWAYEFADSDHGSRRMPEEKGPFGKARKRGLSRSRSQGGAPEKDQAKLDNMRTIDDIFTRHFAQEEKKRESQGLNSALPSSNSAQHLLDSTALGPSFQAGASTNVPPKQPTEVMLYGYGNEVQWAAIQFYEKASQGIIYEEYDREPPHSRYGYTVNQHRASRYRSLSKSALQKVNEFVGGEHWIKVTFDSPEAAERACHYSPHLIQGYTIYAEYYRGTPPVAGDQAIRATAGGTISQTASPNTTSSRTMPASQSSATLSSATVTATDSRPPQEPAIPVISGGFPSQAVEPVEPQGLRQRVPHETRGTPSQAGMGEKPLLIRGAKRAQFLSQDQAFLPAPPRWQQTLGSWPIIGWVIGSGHGIIGDSVPRKEDGSFDSINASLYWRMWYTVDSCFGTDFCGVKDAEYDD
ncbi:hypothetical protein BS50DRAFT_576371 [Corynespora cassiicola Philippines]|uniref:Uncharacterized protein n=1 Tax=Corynespora cassiicola Philippines TaxID=1448308 RepID=A0A2T2NE87_CORCC|nr:hypothetical protein BS50DRAFT_576371 [Corynespora cassiicola Philippines]